MYIYLGSQSCSAFDTWLLLRPFDKIPQYAPATRFCSCQSWCSRDCGCGKGMSSR